ncbi:MAG: Protein-glutamate methylesterase [Bacilli bacterium]|nr:Protein-glutamate methylesterase [Bacilli bacterium]
MKYEEEPSDENFNALQLNDVFTVVGIAASPAKLEVLEQFFNHMIPTSGLAFVISQHSTAKYAALPLEIIEKFTPMKTFRALDKMDIVANCVYLLPPQKEFMIRSGKLFLIDSDPKADQSKSADRFLCSLAESFGNRTIGVLLSGEGNDGILGIETINQVNGIAMVEASQLSKSIIKTEDESLDNNSENILSPQEMPWHILEYIKFHTNHSKESIEEERNTLFTILKQATGVDFSYYKQTSILRRIQRRMGKQGIESLHEYNRYLVDHPSEVSALQKDLLIGVTHFFRDIDAFHSISEKAFPVIFEQRAFEKQIRVWVAGCSTGEEVYSLAILFKQYMQDTKEEYNVKIFATDLDKESIQYASKGSYPQTIAKSVTPEQLRTYFVQVGNEYQINKEIRQMVVFAQHNILKDPPFIQLDLVTCRNMLIYLQPEMQQKVISLFHFALKPDAFLFLGPSETLGKLNHLFSSLDSKWNIYQYKEINHWLSTNSFGITEKLNEKKLNHRNKVNARLKETGRMIKLDHIYAKLIEEYVPSSIIIDENNEIIHISGNASQYLIISKGKPSHSLFKMVPEQLSVAIRTALHKARKENKEIRYQDFLFKNADRLRTINLIAKPFAVNSTNDKLMIILFEEAAEIRNVEFNFEEDQNQLFFHMDHNVNQHIKDLEQELLQAKESLQTTIEELETSNEEFQAANEELIVANEELQSTNEELQSVNEELMVVNNEYQYKIQELTQVNTDMSNFLISSNSATLFLDVKMNIRKFTPAITEEINLIELDIGRPLDDISHHLKYEHLISDAKKVLHTAMPMEKEVQSKNGRWYNLKITPYCTLESLNDGIVLNLIDITELKQASEDLLVLSYAIQQSPGCIVITDTERKIKYINTKYTEITGYTLEDLVDTTLELFSDNLSSEQIREIWNQASVEKKWNGELINKGKNDISFIELASLLPITNQEGEITHFLKISEDITKQKHTLELLHKSEMLSVVGQLAAGIAHEIRNPLTALKGFTKLLEPDTKKKNYIQIMTSELERIELIISELLILARPQKLDFEKKDIIVILQDVIMLLEGQATLNNVEIVTKFTDEIPMINCVQNQLKQVFINILKNGIEAMPQGGHLIVKVKLLEERAIMVSFTDQGVGIPENKIPKLGDPFYSTKDNGTGLGLMVSYKIIENHQGSISIQSTVGKGSTFDIILKTGAAE